MKTYAPYAAKPECSRCRLSSCARGRGEISCPTLGSDRSRLSPSGEGGSRQNGG